MTQPYPNPDLTRWNELDDEAAAREVTPCCGSRTWAGELAARRPFANVQALCEASDRVWRGLARKDWQEAFDSHPRIGERQAVAASARSLSWSATEQQRATSFNSDAEDATKLALAEGNRQYEEVFGHIFIVCATGKSAPEILSILKARMENTPASEWMEAGEQQRQITQLRLHRWLGAE